MSARLRTATAADLDAIMAIEHASFPSDAWSAATMAAELADPNGRYLVAEDVVAEGSAGAVLGYAGLRAPAGAEQADVQTIAVAASARGRGIGRALLRELLAEARRRGAVEVLLEARADNPVARGLYEAHGFLEIAVRPRYYQPDGVDAVVMRASTVPERGEAESKSTRNRPPGRRPALAPQRRRESAFALSGARAERGAQRRVEGPPVVLGIETSCDETGIGIVRGDRLLANVIASSMEEHARYGGVVP